MKLSIPEEEILAPGHLACQGCGATLAMRYALKALGRDTIITLPACCWSVIDGPFPYSAVRVPLFHTAFETAASVASGVEAALEFQGKKGINVLAWAGDGGTMDIGIQALSGAVEREDNFIYVCYDNEAYMNCLSTSSLIMTKDGLKKITEIKEGDEIAAFNQKTYQLVFKKCSGVFDNGKKEVFELQTLHHSIKATGNHPFLVLEKDSNKGKKFIWKVLENIKIGDSVVTLKSLSGAKSQRFNIKMVKKGDYKVSRLNEINLPEYSNPDLMKYLGIYVGDGWTRKEKGEVGFALPKHSEGRRVLIELHSKIFGSRTRTDDKNYVYIDSVNLTNFIDSMGFGKGAKHKIVPAWVYTIPKEEKEAFIEGLMLSDGYRLDRSCRYVSSSYGLLKRLRLLLQTVGYRVGKIHHQKKKKGTLCVDRELLKDSEYGYVAFSKRMPWNTRKYPTQYKYQNFLIENRFFDIERVKTIKSVGIEPTLDLRVEDEHNFIADGIIVHNTGIQRSSSTPYGAWTSTTPVKTFKSTPKKNMVEIMVAHKIPYTATASISHPEDFIAKMRTAKEIKGPKFIQILCPCPVGWKFPPHLTIKMARLAVETNIFPLYEVKNGRYKVKKISKRKPIQEYFKLQGRFKHLTEEVISQIQETIDEEWKVLFKKEGVFGEQAD